MRIAKPWLAWAVMLLLLPLFLLPADAYTGQPGSITISMTYGGSPVSGGEITLYYVGEICRDGAVLAPDFAESGISVDRLSRDTAKALADHAKASGLQGTTRKISRAGQVLFPELTPGLYLLVQTKASPGFYPADPFLASVPMEINGEYRYAVDASPKLSLEKRPPSDSRLPQTGQAHWPVLGLAALGLALLAAGWSLRRRTG